MTGNFEIDNSAYPIGYLNMGGGYKVVDMRNLHPLHLQPISLDAAKGIAAKTNAKMRAGELSTQIDDSGVLDFVFAEVEKL